MVAVLEKIESAGLTRLHVLMFSMEFEKTYKGVISDDSIGGMTIEINMIEDTFEKIKEYLPNRN